MDTKSLRVEVKDDDKGLVRAVFSTFNAIDSDQDVTRPGAFEDGAEVPISSYGHTSWQGALPVGKATIRQDSKKAVLEGQFFMDTTHGRDAFLTVKQLGALGQWSYGYDPVEFSFGEHDGQRVRFLDKVLIHEVSPVLRGAGVGTRTLTAKSAPARAGSKRAIGPHDTPVVSRSWDASAVVSGIAEGARPSDLRKVFAWVDSDADPEAKSSYKFPHHHGVGGPANIRACLAGIAALNGARGGASIPDGERKGVHAHLAAHLRDADRDVPELRSEPGGPMKFAEEGHAVMATLAAFLDRSAEVMALRKKKGKGLAPSSAEVLEWIKADLARLESVLAHPIGDEDPTREQLEAEMASLFARSLAHVHQL